MRRLSFQAVEDQKRREQYRQKGNDPSDADDCNPAKDCPSICLALVFPLAVAQELNLSLVISGNVEQADNKGDQPIMQQKAP